MNNQISEQQQIEILQQNLRQIDLHTRALSTQIQSAEEFYYNDCPQGNLLRGWDANFATPASTNRAKPTAVPETAKVFSGTSVPIPNSISTPTTDDTASMYADIPTISVQKPGAPGTQSMYAPSGPVKRTY